MPVNRRYQKSGWQWFLPLLAGAVLLLLTFFYGFAKYSDDKYANNQFVFQKNEHVASQLRAFSTILQNGISEISRKMVLYTKDLSTEKTGELHDFCRLIVNLHQWFEQVIIIGTDGDPITSSDLLHVPFGKYPHAKWLDELKVSDTILISQRMVSRYGITVGQDVVLAGKKIVDLQGKDIGFVIFTLYPSVFFEQQIHNELLSHRTIHLVHRDGSVVSEVGERVHSGEALSDIPLFGGQLVLRSYTLSPKMMFWHLLNENRGILVSGIVLSFLLMLSGLLIRKNQVQEEYAFVSMLQQAVKERTGELETAQTQIQEKNSELKEMNAQLEKRVREEMKKYETQQAMMIQQSKMAAMGEMLGAIAHQWKQPLNALSISIQDIEEAYDFGELDKRYIKKMVQQSIRQIEYMNTTINDFRNFFKPSRDKKVFRACEVTKDIYRLIEPQMTSRNISYTIHPHEHYKVLGYPNEFKQVVLNIINNARDVFEERNIKEGRIDIYFEHFKTHAIIRIMDNGGGIPEELLPDKIFEAYVSTKGEKGTGIGLYLAKTIIEEKMGGRLEAKNHENGAEFAIDLPLYLGEEEIGTVIEKEDES